MNAQDFDTWNTKKKILSSLEREINFHNREIWYTSLWENIWFEQNGKWENFLRPVLVYKKFNKNIFYWIPLTSKEKDGRFYYTFEFKTWVSSSAILSQMKLIDSKRLYRRIGMMSKEFYSELTEKIKKLLFE